MYQAVAANIMSRCFNEVGTGKFSPGKKPGIKLATYGVVNDLKKFISQKNNDILQKLFGIYANQKVNDFIKEKID